MSTTHTTSTTANTTPTPLQLGITRATKTTPTEAFQVAAEARAFLHSRGVELSGEQQTKTKKALEFFSTALQGAET